MKLALHEIRSAVSFPAVIYIVFYKDEKEALYRLKYIDDGAVRNTMEGEVIFENEGELRIVDKDNNRVVYHIQKNAEKSKFLDATQVL